MHATKCSQQVSYRVEPRRKDLEEEAVYEFSNEEDAPMCIDVHPVVRHEGQGLWNRVSQRYTRYYRMIPSWLVSMLPRRKSRKARIAIVVYSRLMKQRKRKWDDVMG